MRFIIILFMLTAFMSAAKSQNIHGHVMTSTENGGMESLFEQTSNGWVRELAP